jgi:phage terminase large subunit-like protein
VEELAALERDNPPLVYRQEHLAEFVDWSGVAFFDLQKLLVDGKPIPQPKRVDAVFATIDTAVKTGKEHDGTAVVYWGLNRLGDNFPLCLLDYDLIQIEGSLLDTWLQTVFQRGEELARATLSRAGWVGAWIEDKSTGMVLIQQAQRRGWNAHAIESKLTSVGKAERAINISDYVHTEKVKITEHAHNKTVVYKDASRNHLIEQILAFRVGDKDTKRADDLLDTFTYGIEIGLGDQGWV